MAHSFVQSFPDERAAFAAFAVDHPTSTTLLVETYEPIAGIENAIAVGKEMADRGDRLQAIRIDSEPLDALANRARAMLDQAGLTEVSIILSGGLDESRIEALLDRDVPADGFGIGSALVTSSDKAALDVAYKLVDYDGIGRAKYSEDKATYPGRKQIFRAGDPRSDVLERREVTSGDVRGKPLLERCWRDGERLVDVSMTASRERAARQLAELPDTWLLSDGLDEPPTPTIGPELQAFAQRVRERVASAQ
jgi:nicotinate phosphoribosyltransferase